jgi:hypothetical protein
MKAHVGVADKATILRCFIIIPHEKSYSCSTGIAVFGLNVPPPRKMKQDKSMAYVNRNRLIYFLAVLISKHQVIHDPTMMIKRGE